MSVRARRDSVIGLGALVALVLVEWAFAPMDRLAGGQLGALGRTVLALAALSIVALVFSLRRLADIRTKNERLVASDQALLRAESRARLLFEKAPQPMYVYDEETRQILDVNEAALARYGYSREEFLARTLYDLRPASEIDRTSDAADEARRSEDTCFGMFRHALRDGTIIDVDAASHPMTFDGRAARVVVVVDVTRREQALRALRESDARLHESEERFRQMAEAIPSVFYLATADRHTLYISPAFEKVWEQSCESLYTNPRSFLERVHPDDRPRVAASDVVALRRAIEEEYRLVMPDGRVKWISDISFPVYDRQGVLYRVAGVARDVTSQKRLEAELAQVQKMESVGRLAGGVAHDFNNLLTVIFSQAAILEETVSDPEAREEIRQIQLAAERAAALTQQLLAFARRQMYEPRVVDLNVLVESTQRLLARLIGENIELATERSPRPATVRADPGSMEQVLLNLAVNARDAMPRGGRLTIAVGETTVDRSAGDAPPEASDGPHVVITVADTGTGIAAEHLPHVFEPFFTTKPLGQGTGLGLSTVYGIVRQAGGHIRLATEIDRGTEVAVYLPRVVEPAATHAPAATAVSPGGGETVLLVEDDHSVRNVAARVLALAGYRVLQAVDGAHALEVFDSAADSIALVVTDVVMPRIGGPELATRLRARRPGIKVLFTSGYTEDTLVLQELDRSQAFLQKPYMPSALTEGVRALLDVGGRP